MGIDIPNTRRGDGTAAQPAPVHDGAKQGQAALRGDEQDFFSLEDGPFRRWGHEGGATEGLGVWLALDRAPAPSRSKLQSSFDVEGPGAACVVVRVVGLDEEARQRQWARAAYNRSMGLMMGHGGRVPHATLHAG